MTDTLLIALNEDRKPELLDYLTADLSDIRVAAICLHFEDNWDEGSRDEGYALADALDDAAGMYDYNFEPEKAKMCADTAATILYNVNRYYGGEE